MWWPTILPQKTERREDWELTISLGCTVRSCLKETNTQQWQTPHMNITHRNSHTAIRKHVSKKVALLTIYPLGMSDYQRFQFSLWICGLWGLLRFFLPSRSWINFSDYLSFCSLPHLVYFVFLMLLIQNTHSLVSMPAWFYQPIISLEILLIG